MYLRLRALVIIVFVSVCLCKPAYSAQQSPITIQDTMIVATDGISDDILRPGWVIMHWTAPGDDGYVGRATRYEMRYRPSNDGPINSWWAWSVSTEVPNMPAPSSAGSRDSVLVRSLIPNSLYYFCIITYDEVGNRSQLSNSPMKYIPDIGTPRIWGDLDSSGTVDENDLNILVQVLKEKITPGNLLSSCDFNGSGSVDGLDVVYLKAILANRQDHKPKESESLIVKSDIGGSTSSYK